MDICLRYTAAPTSRRDSHQAPQLRGVVLKLSNNSFWNVIMSARLIHITNRRY